MDAAGFFSSFGKRAAFIGHPSGEPALTFGWDEVNSILSSARLKPPRLRLAHTDQTVIERPIVDVSYGRQGVELIRLKAEVLTTALRAGATLVIDAVDEFDASLRQLMRAFARTFGSVPQANLYASFGSSPGFGLHWDDHDVFVFQLRGRKQWTIFDPTRIWPSYRDVDQPTRPSSDASPYIDQLILQGQILYVPRGHWHNVTGLQEPSLHLTIGITHPTPSDIVHWMAEEIKAHSTLRADIPLFTEDTVVTEDDSLSQVKELFTKGSFSRYLEHRVKGLQYRPELSLPFVVTRKVARSAIVVWTGMVRPVVEIDGDVSIATGGQVLTLSGLAAPLVSLLWCKRLCGVADLLNETKGALLETQVVTLLLTLADVDIIKILNG